MRYACVVVALLVTLVASAQTKLLPQYECSGTTESGKRYQLTPIVKETGAALELTWLAAGQTAFVGFGVRKGDTIAAMFADGKQVSVVLYEVKAGQLIGWGPGTGGTLQQELCLAGKPV